MPDFTPADTIRILVATDSHVGAHERDGIRGDDSWKAFHEVMCLAKERDVDMVLLAGDLFHENKPSRKSLYQVMRSLRMNCYGEKPCELEMLSDASEAFAGAFNHVNYEDPDINVAIPVFSIHGNHDDPSGEGHLAALDILEMSGLVNYYGRTPEADNIKVKPVLLQKGQTKLALYGLSNVRDERLFRTFRDGNVTFFQPDAQTGDWFNLMSVHQNHHAYTDTGYLPEHFLPRFMDLVVWGHEHECKIDPTYNPTMGFHVMQPGSSIATSLMPGEAVTKQVAIVSVSGKDFKSEPIRLKSVRPFAMREIALANDKEMRRISKVGTGQEGNAKAVRRYLEDQVEELIQQANDDWFEAQEEAGEVLEEGTNPPLPLIRLRVDYAAPEGGQFDTDNPQRFSQTFIGKVANINDVVQFHRKKTSTRKGKNEPEMPEASVMAQMNNIDSIKVEKLVREFLTAQSLTILPQNSFGDAVTQFVDKDDKHAMEAFIKDSLQSQVEHLIGGAEEVDEDDFAELMGAMKEKLELQYAAGERRRKTKIGKRKPKPAGWDSDEMGAWSDDPAAIDRSNEADENQDDEDGTPVPSKPAGRGRGRGGRGGSAGTTRTTAASKKAPAKATTTTRGKKKQPIEVESSEEEEVDAMVIDDDDDDDEPSGNGLFVSQASSAPTKKASARKAPARSAAATKKLTPATAPKQSQLNFGASQRASGSSRLAAGGSSSSRVAKEPSDDEISDDDAFEPPPTAARRGRR
ncbi:hypothetical protein MBLNU230_g1744t1 [Neophaeotheca triangularis]